MADPLYRIALVGDSTEAFFLELLASLGEAFDSAGLRETDYRVEVNPRPFQPGNRTAAVLVFLGGPGGAAVDISPFVAGGEFPVLPVASDADVVSDEIPKVLRHLNCLITTDPQRVVAGVLEALELLPSQRRVFLSYRRTEARGAALQLFNELSARQFDVFLDTHGIAPGVDFQAGLWHRLCDSDVLVMLDTPTYFERRWTEGEFGRALAKGITVLRVAWPTTVMSRRTETASRVDLTQAEIDPATGELSPAAIDRISEHLERVRALGHVARHLSIVGNVRAAVERVQGQIRSIGANRSLNIRLADGNELVAHLTLGVPTAVILQKAIDRSNGQSTAVIYDHIGLLPDWQHHIDWLGQNVKSARWVKLTDAAWAFGGWAADV